MRHIFISVLVTNNLYFHLQYPIAANMALLGALVDGKLNLARRMLKAGADANSVSPEGYPLLHILTMQDNLPAVRLLLKYGADASIRTRGTRDTELHLVVKYRIENPDFYELLLTSGADCNSGNAWGVTPFHYALAHSSMKILQLLLDHGADITTADRFGRAALHYAAQNPHRDVVTAIATFCRMALHHVAEARGQNDGADVFHSRLRERLDINCTDIDGYSPLHWAAARGSPEGCEVLLRCGAMVNRRSSKTGYSPLTFLLSERSRVGYDEDQFVESTGRIIHLLLENGAEISDKVGDKRLLEVLAQKKVHQCIRNVLIQHMAQMISLHLGIQESDRLIIENRACYKDYYHSCLQELENMKKIRVYNDVSIFDIFVANQKVVLDYAANEQLMESFEEGDYSDMFPIYFDRIKERLCIEVGKQRLRSIASTALSNILKLNDPSHAGIRTILSFLNDEDLRSLRDLKQKRPGFVRRAIHRTRQLLKNIYRCQ